MKRIKDLFHLWPYFILLTAVLIFMSPVILKGYVPIAADSIMNIYHPYRDYFQPQYERGMPYKNFLITDPMLQQYPWRFEAIKQWKQGQLPLWNPYAGLGEPLLANIQSASLYPLNIILFIVPFHIGWTILVILQMILGGVFLYIYLRHLRLHKTSAFVGAFIFIFSGFSVAWLTWNTLFHVVLWLPLILLSIDKIVLHMMNRKTKENNSLLLYCSLFIFALIASFFAGHLQVFAYLLLFVAVYIGAKVIQSKRYIKILSVFFVLFGLVLILTSIQWVPTIQLIFESARDTDQLGWRNKEGWFIPIQHLIQFIVPDFFGNPSTNNYFGTWNYGELIGYVSILPLILSIIALTTVKRKMVRFLGVLLVISIIFATQNPIAMLPFELQIPFLSTSQPTRLIFVIDFILALLAAFGFDQVRKNIHDKKYFIPYIFIFLSFIFLWAGIHFELFTYIKDYSIVKRNLLLPTGVGMVTIVILLSLRYIKSKKLVEYGFILLVILMMFDLVRFANKFTPFVDASLLYPQTKTFTFLQNNDSSYVRMLGYDHIGNQKNIIPPNIPTYYGLQTADTYNPLLLRNLSELFAVTEWGDTSLLPVSLNRMVLFNNISSPLINFMGIKYIATLVDVNYEQFIFKTSEGSVRIYENTDVSPRAFIVYKVHTERSKSNIAKNLLAPNTNLRTEAFSVNDIEVDSEGSGIVMIQQWDQGYIKLDVTTDKKGLVVISNMSYPSWRAKIDGVETTIEEVNLSFQGVVVPAGKHIIELYPTLF